MFDYSFIGAGASGGVGGVMGFALGSVRLGAFLGDVEDCESGEGLRLLPPGTETCAANTEEKVKAALSKRVFFIKCPPL
jgi:hypothetical protein